MIDVIIILLLGIIIYFCIKNILNTSPCNSCRGCERRCANNGCPVVHPLAQSEDLE